MKGAASKNIALCSSFFGRGKPDFQKVFNRFLIEISQSYTLQSTTMTYEIKLIPILIISGLFAKAKFLNMRQYNGYCGCSMCFMPRFHVKSAHVYPHSEHFQMRTPSELIKLLQKAEQGKIQHDEKRFMKRNQDVKRVLGGGKI